MKEKFSLNKCALLGMLLISFLALILSISATMPISPCCGFGSKVVFFDGDEGRPLNSWGCLGRTFGFADTGTEKGFYDEFDSVYLDLDDDKMVSMNDIRITPFAEFSPGSKVVRTDKDINLTLISLAKWNISYIDVNGDGIYSLQDPVYLHNKSYGGNRIASGDIRLSFFSGLPGTRVTGFSADANSFALDLLGFATYIPEVVSIRFFNVNGNYLNGNPQYDRPDAVYLHIIASKTEVESGTMGLVGPNDLRLSL